MKRIENHPPSINIKNASKFVNECLRSNWISTSGKFVKNFEQKISNFTKAKYVIACNTGTAALQVALRIAGVKNGDEVLVPTLTFVGTINSIIYNNASPIFIDSDHDYNIDINKILKFLKKRTYFKNGFCFNKRTKKKIKAIVPVHLWGNPINLKNLKKECNKRNIKIIEDAAEAFGSFIINKRKKYHVGLEGFAGCLSFNANKIITTGGGGAIITNNKNVAKKALYLTTTAKNDSLNFVHNDIGYNYRLSSIPAAVGISEIDNINTKLKLKKKIHRLYKKKLENLKNFSLFSIEGPYDSNHWINILQIKKLSRKNNLKNILKKLLKKGIEARPLWKLNHLQIPFKKFEAFEIFNANDLFKRSICLPSGAKLSSNNIDTIVKILRKIQK